MASEGFCNDCKNNHVETGERQLVVCFNLSLLILQAKGNDKILQKQEKTRKKDEIIKKVSALRNSNGGILLVHMRGISNYNRRTSLFNEYIDQHLNNLIEDGKPFTTEYYKRWYPKSEYLMLIVSASNTVSTADFKTKVALDDCIMRPTSQNMDLILFETKQESPSSQTVLGEIPEESQPLQADLGKIPDEESRSIQFKAIKIADLKSRRLEDLLDHIWNNLRLPEYITSFSKLPKGGSCYLGISEADHTGLSGVKHEGIPLRQEEEKLFQEGIYGKVKLNMRWYSPAKKQLMGVGADFIDIIFYPPNSNGKPVVEIEVAPRSGCVFYDQNGPETYSITENGELERLEFKEWITLFKKRKACSNCQEFKEVHETYL